MLTSQKIEKKSEEKTNDAIKLLIRSKRSQINIKKLTGIDIPKQSTENLLNLYKRLRHGTGLPESVYKTIEKEKKSKTDLLTPAELTFFETLLPTHFIANHVTFSADEILKSNYIYSSKELRRRNISFQSHTPSNQGEDDSIFFSYSLPNKVNTVNFLDEGHIFFVDLDILSQQNPLLSSTFWTSGHFYAYDQEQTTAPVEYRYADSATVVYMRYKMNLFSEYNYVREITFVRPDMTIKLTVPREYEISAGRHIKPFHILRIIEFIRYLDGKTRKYILANVRNETLMANLFDSIFTPGKAELHASAVMPIRIDMPTIFTHKSLSELAERKSGNLNYLLKTSDEISFITALNEHPNWKFYRFTEVINEARYDGLTLLNLAIIYNKYLVAQYLLRLEANVNHPYFNESQALYNKSLFAKRTALQDAVEHKDPKLIKLLCESSFQKTTSGSISVQVNISNIDIYTAIADNLDPNILSYLIRKYRLQNYSIDKFLLVAIFYNNIDALKVLLLSGASPNVTVKVNQNNNNFHLIPLSLRGTALTCAAEMGRYECAKLLLKHADVNGFIRTNGKYDKFGIGFSPLLVAIEHLKTGYDNYIEKEYIPNIRYKNLLLPKKQDYYKVIELFINKGADINFSSGNGVSIDQRFKPYLLAFKWEEIEEKYKEPMLTQRKSVRYQHEGYTIITGLNKNKQRTILLANLRDIYEPPHLCVPGGQNNYLLDKNLNDAAIRLTRLQTGINLTDIKPNASGLKFATDNEVIEIRHYSLPESIEKYKAHENTRTETILEKKQELGSRKLDNIKFIPIDDIKIVPLIFKNITIPLCSYKGVPLRPLISLSVPIIAGKKMFCTPEIKDIFLQLHCKPYRLLHDSIEKNKIDDVKTLFQFGIFNKETMGSNCLVKSLKLSDDTIFKYLIEQGLRLESAFFTNLMYENTSYSEELFLFMLQKHSIEDYQWPIIASFIGKNNYLTLLERVSNYWKDCALAAFKHANFKTLEIILSKINLQQRTDLIDAMIRLISMEKLNNFTHILTCISYVLKQFRLTFKHYHALLETIFYLCRNIIDEKKDVSLLNQFFPFFDLLINKIDFTQGDSVIECYRIYRKLARANIPTIADTYLKSLCNIPVMKIWHALKRRNENEVDQLLLIYQNDSTVQNQYLSVDNMDIIYCQDEKNITRLQRAVKRNSIELVNLLLTKCSKHESFNINQPDDNKATPLYNAINLGHTAIAELLIHYNSEITIEMLDLAQQKKNENIVKLLTVRMEKTPLFGSANNASFFSDRRKRTNEKTQDDDSLFLFKRPKTKVSAELSY